MPKFDLSVLQDPFKCILCLCLCTSYLCNQYNCKSLFYDMWCAYFWDIRMNLNTWKEKVFIIISNCEHDFYPLEEYSYVSWISYGSTNLFKVFGGNVDAKDTHFISFLLACLSNKLIGLLPISQIVWLKLSLNMVDSITVLSLIIVNFWEFVGLSFEFHFKYLICTKRWCVVS